jgi:hypothetical protein
MFNKIIKTPTIFQSIFLIGLILFFIASCKKTEDHDDDHNHSSGDTDKPMVQISSPTDLKMYNNGDTVHITGKATDASLHEMVIKIVNSADGTEMFKSTPTVHDLTEYNFDVKWKSSVNDHTNAKVIVLAEDHSSNVGSDTVNIHIMP